MNSARKLQTTHFPTFTFILHQSSHTRRACTLPFLLNSTPFPPPFSSTRVLHQIDNSSAIGRYIESSPQFQILHCLRNRVHGNTSLFVDALAADESLRAPHHPDFTCLVTTPVSFQYVYDPLCAFNHHLRPRRQRHRAPSYHCALFQDLSRSIRHMSTDSTTLLHQPTGSWLFGYVRCRVLYGFTAFEVRRFAGMGGREASGEASRWLKGCSFSTAMQGRVMVGC